MLLLVPLFYVAYFVFWLLVVGTVIVLDVAFYVILFFGAALVMAIHAVFRTPRRPPPPRIPQARFSNRR